MSDCTLRITNYLSSGGLFNPELMEHEKVSLLLQDCRDSIQSLEAKNAELEKKLHEANMRSAPELEKKLEIAMSCTKNIRERLRSKSVSMRAFKIIDDEISKMKAAIKDLP